MRKEFYQKVLPAQGVYCATGIDKNKKIINQFAETLSDLFTIINQLEENEQNIFVALSSFSGHSRKSDYAAFSKSFFIDLDVGTEPNKYPSKDAALIGLMEFCDGVQLPPPVVIDSGNGIHAYWVLDRDVQIDEWKLYADKFKKLCLAHSLRIDPVVTADVSRIMRCPETVNYKREPYSKTSFITEDIFEYDYSVFKELLGPVEPPVKSILSDVPKGLDDDTKALLGFDNFQTTFQSIAERSLSGEGCSQIRFILTNSASLPEPLWHSGLSIARHCEDWETAIQLMSEDYPGYNAEHTVRKANETLNKPQSCAVIESRNPGGCDGCAFKGRITNPLAIGRELKTAPPQDAPPDPVRLATDPKAVPDFPQFLYPFVRGVNGGIYFVPPDEEGDDGKRVKLDPVMICAHLFFPIKRTFNRTEGESYEIRIVMPHETRELVIPMEAFNRLDDFKKRLGSYGIVPPYQKLWPLLVDYMNKWASYFQHLDAAEQTRAQMGWTEDNNAFVIGELEITRNGGDRKAASSALVRGISKLLKPHGEYDLWKKAFSNLNLPSMEMIAFGVLSGFGSPLMRFCSTSGATLCFVGNSGNGKTGLLYGALSIFGAPKELSVYDATENGMVMRALNLKNIVFGMDEVGNREGLELSRLIHSNSQGKGKIRMQSSVNAERELELTAAQLCLLTSNHSVLDKLVILKENPNGEVARLMEYQLRLPQAAIDNPNLGRETYNVFRENYGFAGPDYIRHLMHVGDEYISQKINHWREKFVDSRFGVDPAYRFYENAIATIFAGGELAIEAKIIDLDLERIFDAAVLETIRVREGTGRVNQVDYEALVTEFIDKHWVNLLMFDGNRVTNEPKNALMGRIELDTETFLVSKTEFRKFLADKKIGVREFEQAMLKKNVSVETRKMRLSSGWKSAMGVMSPLTVYAFKAKAIKELTE